MPLPQGSLIHGQHSVSSGPAGSRHYGFSSGLGQRLDRGGEHLPVEPEPGHALRDLHDDPDGQLFGHAAGRHGLDLPDLHNHADALAGAAGPLRSTGAALLGDEQRRAAARQHDPGQPLEPDHEQQPAVAEDQPERPDAPVELRQRRKHRIRVRSRRSAPVDLRLGRADPERIRLGRADPVERAGDDAGHERALDVRADRDRHPGRREPERQYADHVRGDAERRAVFPGSGFLGRPGCGDQRRAPAPRPHHGGAAGEPQREPREPGPRPGLGGLERRTAVAEPRPTTT